MVVDEDGGNDDDLNDDDGVDNDAVEDRWWRGIYFSNNPSERNLIFKKKKKDSELPFYSV